ncbi:MAG: hypothetical protein NVSMB42_10900 [Herpetosiphon sp.]
MAELLLARGQTAIGLSINAVLILGLLLLGSLTRAVGERRLALSLTVAPLMTLLSMSLPLTHLPPLAVYPTVGLPLLFTTWLVGRRSGLSWKVAVFRLHNVLLQLVFAGSGVAIGVVEYHILQPAGLVQALSWYDLWLPIIVLIVFVGLAEEILFRGVLQALAIPVLGSASLLYISLLVGALHVGYRSLREVLFAFGVSILFAYHVYWGKSLLGVTLAHSLASVTLLVIMPVLANSGGATLTGMGSWLMICSLCCPVLSIGRLWQITVRAGRLRSKKMRQEAT